MAKIDIELAFIYSKRAEVRDVIRQALKSRGMETANIHNVLDEKEILAAVEKTEFSYLIIDWEVGAESVQKVLSANRKSFSLESHPSYLLAAQEDEQILAIAREFHISFCTIGEINADTIRDQIDGLMSQYRRLSPVRQVLLTVEALRRDGQEDKAHDTLVKLQEKSPENPRIAVELAESYFQRGEESQAEELLKPHLSSEPPYARIKHLYARCRLKKNDYNGAIASLKGAQLISPYNTERLLEMGDLFLELDRVDEAIESYNDILNFAPEMKSAKLGKSKGMLLAGEVNEALGILRECASNRELSSVFNTAAIIATKQEKYDVGFGLYKKALQLLAKDKTLSSRILFNMGIGFVKFGEGEKGKTCFSKALELDPEFEKAKFNHQILVKKSDAIQDAPIDEFEEMDGLDETLILSPNDPASPVSDLRFDEEGADLDALFDDVENF